MHWLSWQCGLDPRSARVRVARALLEFVEIRDAFAVRALSYSKVRAIARIVTPETEVGLVGMARPLPKELSSRRFCGTARGAGAPD